MRDRYVCAKAGVLRFVGRTVPELYPVAVRFYCQGSFVGLRSRYVVQRCRERVEVVFRILAKASKNNNLRCKCSFLLFPCCLRGNMKVKGGVILKKDPELYEVFDYFRKVLIDELDNADIETTEGQTIKTAVVTAAEKVCSQLKPIE